MTRPQLNRQLRQLANECSAELAKGDAADLVAVASVNRQAADLVARHLPGIVAREERLRALALRRRTESLFSRPA